MTEDTAREEKARLEKTRTAMARQLREIQHDLNKIDARLLAIKWAEYPIGCRVVDKRGYEYEVCGYENAWLLGRKIKKDGMPGGKLVAICGEVEKMEGAKQ